MKKVKIGKTIHLKHPILPDDTLCSSAINDNYEKEKIVSDPKNKVNCSDCIEILSAARAVNLKDIEKK